MNNRAELPLDEGGRLAQWFGDFYDVKDHHGEIQEEHHQRSQQDQCGGDSFGFPGAGVTGEFQYQLAPLADKQGQAACAEQKDNAQNEEFVDRRQNGAFRK